MTTDQKQQILDLAVEHGVSRVLAAAMAMELIHKFSPAPLRRRPPLLDQSSGAPGRLER